MQCKEWSVIGERLSLLYQGGKAILSNGGAYPEWEKVSLKAVFYGESAFPRCISVLKNTGILPFWKIKARLGEFKECKIGDEFGKSWATHWFYVELEVPESWREKEVHLLWDSSSEALLFDTEGLPLQGFTGTVGRAHRVSYIIQRSGYREGTSSINYFLEMSCCNFAGNVIDGNMLNGEDLDKMFKLTQCEIRVFNRAAYELWHEFKVLHDCGELLTNSQSSRAEDALYTGNCIMNKIVVEDSGTYPECTALAQSYRSLPNPPSQHQIYACGHCHIDVAWLWPFTETRRKAARSWAAQIEYMRYYPHFKFTASNAVLYNWVQSDYPLLFAEIKEFIQKGQFIPVGGSWLEFDANLPSGESLNRQFLYGQRYFKRELGAYAQVFFLPDSFGYNGNLPQQMKAAGMKYFFSQKLTYNEFNEFPNSSFRWKGIDGSEVLCHFPPANRYDCDGGVEDIMKSQTGFKEKGRSNCSIMLFGIGDGGGGPHEDMIEQVSRLKDCDGLPKVMMSGTQEFFEVLEEGEEDLVSWEGELFLEKHHGTYTSQCRMKEENRRAEYKIREVEIFSMFNILLQMSKEGSGAIYEKSIIDSSWQQIMLYQFHDIITGVSIKSVYDQGYIDYDALNTQLDSLLSTAITQICLRDLQFTITTHNPNSLVIFNSLPFQRQEMVTFSIADTLFQSYLTVPPLGFALYPLTSLTSLTFSSNHSPQFMLKGHNQDLLLTNQFLEVEFSNTGRIIALRDKTTMKYGVLETMREVISLNQTFNGANAICLHHDIPVYWDAWDLWIYYMDTRQDILASSYEVLYLKPNELELKFTYKISEVSSMTQSIILGEETRRLDFKTWVDWHEDHKVLRVYFPLNIKTDYATFDIQNGNIRRPTTSNTSWDTAKYEVCGHKYGDMSESNYGVAVLNTCKYGYSARENILSLSLLKSGKGPDKECDMGFHNFTYSMYPHTHSFEESDVIEQAYLLNVPCRQYLGYAIDNRKQVYGLFQLDAKNVMIDAIKVDEQTQNRAVIRLHEDQGHSTVALLKMNIPSATRTLRFLQVTLSNTLEEEIPDNGVIIRWDATTVLLRFTPFQMITLNIFIALN